MSVDEIVAGTVVAELFRCEVSRHDGEESTYRAENMQPDSGPPCLVMVAQQAESRERKRGQPEHDREVDQHRMERKRARDGCREGCHESVLNGHAMIQTSTGAARDPSGTALLDRLSIHSQKPL